VRRLIRRETFKNLSIRIVSLLCKKADTKVSALAVI